MSERTRWAKRAKQRSANEQVLVDANKSLLKRIAELEAELRLAESRDRRPCDLSHELADWCQCGWSRNERD